MECPFFLTPFNLQGLEVNAIYQVVQWLVKFVYETREETQQFNRQISINLGNQILGIPSKKPKKMPISVAKRVRINKAIEKTDPSDPIRVYSSLLEFKDASSLKMYHKLHNMMINKDSIKSQKGDGSSNKISLKDTQEENFEER